VHRAAKLLRNVAEFHFLSFEELPMFS
jgi:hypothetical protein